MPAAARVGSPTHFVGLFLAMGLLLVGSTIRADDPKPDLAAWGQFVDPAGDCDVQETNGTVTIAVPGSEHNLNPEPAYDNILGPRVLQTVEGDFRLQVKVLAYPRPKAKTSANKQGHSYVAAGLIVWQDDKTFLRWFRSANGELGDLFAHGEAFKNAARQEYRVLQNSRTIPDKATFLSIERSQGQFTLSWSEDGQRWTAFARMADGGYAKKLQVGVGVVNATKVPFAPEFQELQLKPGKEKP